MLVLHDFPIQLSYQDVHLWEFLNVLPLFQYDRRVHSWNVTHLRISCKADVGKRGGRTGLGHNVSSDTAFMKDGTSV